QAGIDHFLDDVLGADFDSLRQALVTAMRLVIFEAARVDDAAILEGEPGLALKPRNVLDEAKSKLVLSAFKHSGIDQAVDITDATRSKADAPFWARNLN